VSFLGSRFFQFAWVCSPLPPCGLTLSPSFGSDSAVLATLMTVRIVVDQLGSGRYICVLGLAGSLDGYFPNFSPGTRDWKVLQRLGLDKFAYGPDFRCLREAVPIPRPAKRPVPVPDALPAHPFCDSMVFISPGRASPYH